MKLILTSLFLTFGFTATHGQVVIYKFVHTNVWTGADTKFAQKVSGRFVFDAQAAESPRLLTALPGKKFLNDCPTMEIKYFTGPRGADLSAWFVNGAGYDPETSANMSIIQTYLRGQNANVLVGPTNRLLVPKILRGVYRGSFRSSDGDDIVGEANITYTLDGAATVDANTNERSLEQVVSALIQTYLDNGWSEETPDAPCP